MHIHNKYILSKYLHWYTLNLVYVHGTNAFSALNKHKERFLHRVMLYLEVEGDSLCSFFKSPFHIEQTKKKFWQSE